MKLEVVQEVSCDNCGGCCMHMHVPPVTPWDREIIPDHLWDEIQAYVWGDDYEDKEEPCKWLDLQTRKCKHYEYRPQVCREYEKGSDSCLKTRQFYLKP